MGDKNRSGRIIAVIAVLLLVFSVFVLITASQAPKLSDGYIRNKRYIPASSVTSGSFGKERGNIDSWTHDARYMMLIENGPDSEWWFVTEDEFNKYHVGDYIRR